VTISRASVLDGSSPWVVPSESDLLLEVLQLVTIKSRGPENRRSALRSLLHTLNNAEVAFRGGAEGLKRLLVRLAFVRRQCVVKAVELDHNSRQW